MGSPGPNEMVVTWLSEFHDALQQRDLSRAVDLFQEDECFWRDMVAFTWNVHTAESRDEIAEMLEATLDTVQPSLWEIDGEAVFHEPQGIVEALIKFETRVSRGRGVLRLRGAKCWILLTAMTELKGYEEKAGRSRITGGLGSGKTWLEERKEEEEELGYSKQPYCVVVGGGQAGITIGARLRQLGVPTVIVDKNERSGDSWRNRYKSLCLHSPVWDSHLPYIPFPSNWPVFASKDKLGDWLEFYTRVMELDFWTSSLCKRASYDATENRWEVTVDRAGTEVVLRPAHLVLATGVFSMPNVPSFPGAESFQGVQCHSSQYRFGEEWAGKQCVVVGSNTSAHDICSDLLEKGAAQVTMVQRGSTCVVSKTDVVNLLEMMGYCEGSPTDTADLKAASVPFKVAPAFSIPYFSHVARIRADFYAALEKAGFQIDFGEDGSGFFMKGLRRGGGYYIDVGASQHVASGAIKLKNGAAKVKEVRPNSVLFTDGSEIPADLLVYSTGYAPVTEGVAQLISREVADKVGRCWGLGSDTHNDPGPWERELRNMWKPTQQPGLWFHSGSLMHCRYYSLILALQIKARFEAIPTPVFALAPVHHVN